MSPKFAPKALGFTLIEMIGTLAIVCILAAVLIPKVIKQIDQAAFTKEVNDMTAIANAVVQQVIRSNAVPDATSGANGWAQAAARWTQRPVSQILVNNRGFNRLCFYDNGGWMSGIVPYTQTNTGTGTTIPSNARMVLVSTIAKQLPSTNGPLDSASFNSIWNAAQGSVPTFLSTGLGWSGKAEDLVIQRISLDSLFHQLILINRGQYGDAKFAINASTTLSVTNDGNGFSSCFLDGSAVALCNSGGVPVTKHILKRNISFVFENGAWYGQLIGAQPTNLVGSFLSSATNFFNSPSSSTSQGAHNAYDDTSAVVAAMCNFMVAYTMWASDIPHFNNYSISPITQVNMNKVLMWKLIDIEAAGVAQSGNVGNLDQFSNDSTGVLQLP
jgi:prepilin-type N-terminal cleavage/methylation domain-containing protein